MPRCYRPYEAIVLTEDGREREAVAYRVFADRIAGTFYPPRLDYAAALREGLLSHGLDDRMLMAVAAGREAPWTVDHIFVYGTLMKGFARHHLLEAWAHPMTRQEARAPGVLFDSRKGHPCLVPAKKAGQVARGEMYRLQDNRQAFEMLDIVEDFRGYGDARSEFRRALVRAETAGGHKHAGPGLFLQQANGEAGRHRTQGTGRTGPSWRRGVFRNKEGETKQRTSSCPLLFSQLRKRLRFRKEQIGPLGR